MFAVIRFLAWDIKRAHAHESEWLQGGRLLRWNILRYGCAQIISGAVEAHGFSWTRRRSFVPYFTLFGWINLFAAVWMGDNFRDPIKVF